MPKFIPYYNTEEVNEYITNSGERKLYNSFRQLPDEWEIYHSVHYHYRDVWNNQGSGKTWLREQEIDFIIIVPNKGLLFVEVKGSYGFEIIDRTYYRVDRNDKRTRTRNPFEQVSEAMHNFKDQVSKRFENQRFPAKFGYVVILPNGQLTYDHENLYDKATYLSRRDLNSLKIKLENALDYWGASVPNPSSNQLNKIRSFIGANAGLERLSSSELDEDEKTIDFLTKRQLKILQELNQFQDNIALISGEAGSGKTMIAKWICQSYCGLGKKVLFLCYNKNLASWLSSYFDKLELKVDVVHFHKLCIDAANKNGVSLQIPRNNSQEFWESTAPDALLESIDNGKQEKYDVVVVDEGQDFEYFWWACVTNLVSDFGVGNGMLHIFYDHNQSLYTKDDSPDSIYEYFEEEAPLTHRLSENCRNTKNLVKYTSNAVEREITPFSISPKGKAPEILSASSNVSHRANLLKSKVNEILQEGYLPSQIAILSPYSYTNNNNCFQNIQTIGNSPLLTQINNSSSDTLLKWNENNGILATTVRSFKGLEADCIILTDVPDPNQNELAFQKEDLYVALTRAKHLLYIIPAYKNAEDIFRLWGAELNESS